MALADTKSQLEQHAVEVRHLDFNFRCGKRALTDVSVLLKPGTRTLLCGDNGAGKTTLLKILGGKHKVDDTQVKVLGKPCMFSSELNLVRSYLGGDWGKRTVAFVGFGVPMTADIEVKDFMSFLQKQFPKRREKLYDLLDINPKWNMATVSDGQRRRVQIMLGLLRPFSLLLLDEITTDLDVVTRQDLLAFLRRRKNEA